MVVFKTFGLCRREGNRTPMEPITLSTPYQREEIPAVKYYLYSMQESNLRNYIVLPLYYLVVDAGRIRTFISFVSATELIEY